MLPIADSRQYALRNEKPFIDDTARIGWIVSWEARLLLCYIYIYKYDAEKGNHKRYFQICEEKANFQLCLKIEDHFLNRTIKLGRLKKKFTYDEAWKIRKKTLYVFNFKRKCNRRTRFCFNNMCNRNTRTALYWKNLLLSTLVSKNVTIRQLLEFFSNFDSR